MITSVAQFKSHMTAKSATRSSAKMAKKMPSASTDVSVMPRRSEFPHGGDGDKEWGDKVDKSSDNYGKAIRAQTTSDEHDQYFWSFNEYGKRQGFPSYTERTKLNEVLRASSGSGRLKPTYETESGMMRVAPWQLVLAFLLDLGSGSSETPKGGHPADEPWKTTSGRS